MDDLIAALFGHAPMTPDRVNSQYAQQMRAWERQALVAQQNNPFQGQRGILSAQQANAALARMDLQSASLDWLNRIDAANAATPAPHRRAITTHNLPRMTRHYRWTM